MTLNPSRPTWDAIFVWAAGCGKGADEIDRMFGVMVSMNATLPKKQHRLPDITTIK